MEHISLSSLLKTLISYLLGKYMNVGARSSLVGRGTMLQDGKSGVRFSMRSLDFFFFFNLPNPSSRIMALGSTQPLTEMSTRNLPAGYMAACA
jgi:hypothetical protein